MPEPAPNALVPPPNVEVRVRTLETDLAAIRASGGSALSPAGITGSLPSHEAAHPVSGAGSHMASAVLGWLAVFLAIAALAAGAYLGYGYLNRTASDDEPLPRGNAASSTASSLPTASSAALPATLGEHRTQLARPAPFSLSFPLEAQAGELKTHFQLIREGLDRIPGAMRVAEINPTDAAGRPLSFAGFLDLVGAPSLLPRTALADAIAPDFTLLAVRGQGGFSAAYVLSLKPESTWVYAEPEVRRLEESTEIPNVFLQLPGNPDALGFRDDTLEEYPIRSESYLNPASTFSYGWFKNRLVIATSRQALQESLLLLCLEPGSC